MSSGDDRHQWPPHHAREAALRAAEAGIAAAPDSVAPRLRRADLLAELGRTAEAREAYLDVLSVAPADRLALNNLGTLLHNTGYRTAARTAYAEAVARHPNDPMSHVNLANALYQNGELDAAREHFAIALRCDPEHAEAHQGLSYVLAELGDAERAASHRQKGFRDRPVVTLPYHGETPPVRLLLLVSSLGGNIPTRTFLDDHRFETTVVVADFYDTSAALPAHEIIFNAIGDADLSPKALLAAQSICASSRAPILNTPEAVLATGRAANAQRLSCIPGLTAPAMVTLPRAHFNSPEANSTLAGHGLTFPLLVRSPGFHTGRHFVLAERPDLLLETIAPLPGDELTAIQYLDSRGRDGKARKYRVMMIDGQLYPLHLAISSHWKIHYFTAEMADHPEHRAEDAAFLQKMPAVLGARAMSALEQVQTALGLHYAGIDFGLSHAGDVLLYEANATMVVNPPEPDQRWTYRRPAVERIFAATRRMLLEKAGNSASL